MSPERLDLWSEPFPASGGMTAEGVKNALGRPRMDLPTLLVRETVQNSWDAGLRTGVRPIRFRIEAGSLTGDRLASIRRFVFPDVPDAGLPLRSVLADDEVPVLIISDRGTSGLGGPTQAGVRAGEPTDFADFVRNVGQPPDKERGGGTFGFGKAVLYMASRASTIVVHTRCRNHESVENRLIAIGLGEPFPAMIGEEERLHTGRHWWGRRDPDAGIEPVLGEAARELARAVGMPTFNDDELGTSIMIIGAEFGELDLRAAVEEMSEAILWHCWPKMLGAPPQMFFDISCDNDQIAVPDPRNHPDLKHFVDSYRVALGGETRDAMHSSRISIDCGRPVKHLGQLGLGLFPNVGVRPAGEIPGRPFAGPPHHVALMRVPRLVVTYLEGPESPVQEVEWAGTFVADDDVDRAFAQAEPPSHDDWIVDTLPRSPEKTFVNVALRNIRREMKQFTGPRSITEDGEIPPLAALAGALGGLLAGDIGPGTRQLPEGHTGGGQSGGGGKRGPVARVEVLERELIAEGGEAVLRIRFRVTPASGSAETRIRAESRVAVNDGSSFEREHPIGADLPGVVRWEVDGTRISKQEDILVRGEEIAEGTVLVSVPEDTGVSVSITAAPGTEGPA